MRIRATCRACDRDFLFFELRNTGAGITDRCPSCNRLLGARGLLAVRAEQALAVLVGSLEELARHDPNFTVHAGTVLKPVEDALTTLAVGPAAKPEKPLRRRWQRQRIAA
jgi:hypothetical protein